MMKFLLDSNLSHRVARLLRDAGIDATHVRDHELQHATDLTILMFARQHLGASRYTGETCRATPRTYSELG